MGTRSVGRPSQLTPRMHKALVAAVADGNFLESAACLAGVDPSTCRRWIARGTREAERRLQGGEASQDDEVYVRFAAAMREADARAEGAALRQLRRRGRADWKACAWFLEHRFPEKWATRLTERHVAREFESFLDKLEQSLDAPTFERVLEVISAEPRDRTDPG